jgi:chromosomal replication initiator protein
MNSVYIPAYKNKKVDRNTVIQTDKIFSVVQEYFGVSKDVLMSRTRKVSISYPRQVCIWLLSKYSCHSVPGIAVFFSFKDSSSALNAVKSIDNYLATDEKVKEQISLLEEKLKNGNT